MAGFSITTQAVDVRRGIGYVPQAVSVDGSLTGYEKRKHRVPNSSANMILRDFLRQNRRSTGLGVAIGRATQLIRRRNHIRINGFRHPFASTLVLPPCLPR